MAEHDILLNMILRPGQSQAERMPAALAAHYVDVDERTAADLLRSLRKLAAQIRYYADDPMTPAGNWADFFPADDAAIAGLLAHDGGEATPHLALLAAFLELYKLPQELLNRITGRHLDFFYKEVLRFAGKGAVPDRAHLLVELKKNAQPLVIGPEQQFLAGKTRSYAPEFATVLTHAQVRELKSFFVETTGHGRVLMAPVANSADGLGAPLDPADPKWQGFGHPDLPQAAIGFALAAPVLRMREGTRTITVTLTLASVKEVVNSAMLRDAFEVFLTGEKQWLGPYRPHESTVTAGPNGTSLLRFFLTLPASEQAVVDYEARVHGGAWASDAPVLQVLLREECRSIGYNELENLVLGAAEIEVEVTGLHPQTLENDAGLLDGTKVFLPFGNQPAMGSRLSIGCPEVLDKQLSELSLAIQWHDAPPQFATRYKGYGERKVANDDFTAAVSFDEGGTWQCRCSGEPLFSSVNATLERVMTFRAPGQVKASGKATEAARLHGLHNIKAQWAASMVKGRLLTQPAYCKPKATAPESRKGVVTISLERDFLHTTYRRKSVELVVTYSRTGEGSLSLIDEPYTPAIRSLTLGYRAQSGAVAVGRIAADPVTLDDCLDSDLQFFHVTPFGQMREHGFQREQMGFIADTRVHLLPRFDHRGELLIGLAQVQGGDSVSLLFQVAEGSADPDLPSQPIAWSILCDNYWRPLGTEGVVRDTTNQLLTSGIVTFVLPTGAGTDNTLLPSGLIWLRATVDRDPASVAQLIEVAANAVLIRQTSGDPTLPATVLPAGSIGKMRSQPAGIKSFRQPYATFGGRSTESEVDFRRRVAERLRHKNRCQTPWDYERIVLEAFPAVHRVKCIPHATGDSWLAPGNVLLTVIPDLRNRNGVNPLQPKVDADTLARIVEHVRARCGGQVAIRARNPRYQQVHLDCRVRLHRGYGFNISSKEIEQAIIRRLSPWAFDQSRQDIGFGGVISKSVLLDFIEALPTVDYVEELRMHSYSGDAVNTVDLDEVRPQTPDAILVSAPNHRIREA